MNCHPRKFPACNACSNIDKLSGLGWSPRYTPETSVADYVAWLHQQDNVEDILDYADKTMKNSNVVRSTSAGSN